MSRQTYLTQIMLCSHGHDDRDVTITHRRKTATGVEWFDKVYQPTKASQKRIDRVATDWVNRGDAQVQISDYALFIEPTI